MGRSCNEKKIGALILDKDKNAIDTIRVFQCLIEGLDDYEYEIEAEIANDEKEIIKNATEKNLILFLLMLKRLARHELIFWLIS